YLYSLADKKQTAVTDDWYSSGTVSFSDDGKYLLFSSARDFKPTFGEQQFAEVYRDMDRVYLVTLSKDTPSPLAPKSDEVGNAEKKKKDKEKDKDKATGDNKADAKKSPNEDKNDEKKPAPKKP